jgi:hypothetical protein
LVRRRPCVSRGGGGSRRVLSPARALALGLSVVLALGLSVVMEGMGKEGEWRVLGWGRGGGGGMDAHPEGGGRGHVNPGRGHLTQ